MATMVPLGRFIGPCASISYTQLYPRAASDLSYRRLARELISSSGSRSGLSEAYPLKLMKYWFAVNPTCH